MQPFEYPRKSVCSNGAVPGRASRRFRRELQRSRSRRCGCLGRRFGRRVRRARLRRVADCAPSGGTGGPHGERVHPARSFSSVFTSCSQCPTARSASWSDGKGSSGSLSCSSIAATTESGSRVSGRRKVRQLRQRPNHRLRTAHALRIDAAKTFTVSEPEDCAQPLLLVAIVLGASNASDRIGIRRRWLAERCSARPPRAPAITPAGPM